MAKTALAFAPTYPGTAIVTAAVSLLGTGLLAVYNANFDDPEHWDRVARQLTDEVEADPATPDLISDLLLYARAQVEHQRSRIEAGVEGLQLGTVDLLWPGNGYNQAAYGGTYEVLALLEKAGVLKIGRIIGASGGACSTILALADDDLSSRTLLLNNLVYARWSQRAWDPQVLRCTALWSALYRQALRSDGAFARVRERGHVACLCGRGFLGNDILSNFTSREQCAEAYYASGDASLLGLLAGTRIRGVAGQLGACLDGGQVAPRPGSDTPWIYYGAFYDYTMYTSPDTIDELFRKGVDETINLLTTLASDSDGGTIQRGDMLMVLPHRMSSDEAAAVEQGYLPARFRDTTFHNVALGSQVKQSRG